MRFLAGMLLALGISAAWADVMLMAAMPPSVESAPSSWTAIPEPYAGWDSPIPGTYTHYVDASAGNCSDAGNGTPAVPRCSIPLTMAAGDVVEIHAGNPRVPYDLPGSGGAEVDFNNNGTSSNRVFVYGVDDGDGLPLIVGVDMARICGQYFTWDGFIFDVVLVRTGCNSGPANAQFATFRNIEQRYHPSKTGLILTGSNLVCYQCEVHHNCGDDRHGLQTSTTSHDIWFLECHSHHNGGDGLQFGHTSSPDPPAIPPYNIYTGGLLAHDNRENAFDTKWGGGDRGANIGNVVLSDSLLYNQIPAYTNTKTAGRSRHPWVAWQADVSGPSYVDQTDALVFGVANSIPLFPANEAPGDYWTFGFSHQVDQFNFDYASGTAGVGGTVVWEYYSGAGGWTAFNILADNTNNFTAAPADGLSVIWTLPAEGLWRRTSINGSSPLFYARARVLTTYSTNPIMDGGIIEAFNARWCAVDDDTCCNTDPSSASDGGAVVIGTDGDTLNLFVVNNRVHSSQKGIRIESSGDLNTDRVYVVGNEVYNIFNHQPGGNYSVAGIQLDKWGWHFEASNNVVHNVGNSGSQTANVAGIYMADRDNFALHFSNNIISDINGVVMEYIQPSVYNDSDFNNNLFWNDGGNIDIFNGSSTVSCASAACVNANIAGTASGNLVADPLFVNEAVGSEDFNFQSASSPAVNTGNTTIEGYDDDLKVFTPNVTLLEDLNGTLRPVDNYDMGSREYVP